MLKDAVLTLLDDPICQQLMASDHLTRNETLMLLERVKPLCLLEREREPVDSFERRRDCYDRRQPQPRLQKDGEIERRSIFDRRLRPTLAQESPPYWFH